MAERILLIDNYDSFTYNLVHCLEDLGCRVLVYRNDELTAEEAEALDIDRVVISPGPGGPESTGVCTALLLGMSRKTPFLGVCLGHQLIGAVFGARVVRAQVPAHGKTSLVWHDGKTLFAGLENPIEVMRYHSLAIDPGSVPPSLEVSGFTDDGVIMGVRHRELPVEGVQFHPESIMTPSGMKLLENFLSLSKG